jgi:hypothetical protein
MVRGGSRTPAIMDLRGSAAGRAPQSTSQRKGCAEFIEGGLIVRAVGSRDSNSDAKIPP